jgi:hypothetical protein
MKDLAATYSRASYTGTTIGKAAFDGRVRDGIGSDHSFMATKNWSQNFAVGIPGDSDVSDKMLKNGSFLENYTQALHRAITLRELKLLLVKESNQAARPISISPLNALQRLHA